MDVRFSDFEQVDNPGWNGNDLQYFEFRDFVDGNHM